MKTFTRQILFLFGLLAATISVAATGNSANENNRLRSQLKLNASQGHVVTRIVYQRRSNKRDVSNDQIVQDINYISGVHWRSRRGAVNQLQLLSTDTGIDSQTAARVVRALQSRGDIQFAAIDKRRHVHATPSDALYPDQWYLQNTQPAAIAASTAWDVTTGNAGTIVAVLDTGVRFDHPDLQRIAQSGKLLPGFDFVSADNDGGSLAANDGDGWDADPTDPGDWIDSNDRQKTVFNNCFIENSSWHGTRVAGMIAAASNNGTGIAGVAWNTLILPVRVLGKCGGYDSDIFAAMRWAAGMPVSGVPDNPYPAKILNLSLGGAGTCSAAYRDLIQELADIGVLVVVSAGNEGGPVDEPANCPLALGVAGLRHIGTKVGYSSLGPEVAIAAPAGNCVNATGACLFSLATTYDIGTTSPAGSDYTNQFNTNLGTSFSAPLAAGVAALMHGVNSQLSSQQLRARMREGARAFPVSNTVVTCHVPTSANDIQASECNCTTNTCGAGMLYAPGAVIAAQRPIATINLPTNFSGGSTITVNGSASSAANNRLITSYSWSIVAYTSASPPVLTTTNQSSLQVIAPTTGTYTLRLTVTDNLAATDSSDAVVIAPPPPPPPAESGGGGNIAWFTLLSLALLWILKRLGRNTARYTAI